MVPPDLVFMPKEIEMWVASLLVTLLLVNKDLAKSSVKKGLFWLTGGDHSIIVGKVWQLEQEAGYSLEELTGSGSKL